MVQKNEIAALLEALCEGPPDHGGPELQALRLEAAKALLQARDADGDSSASPAGDDAFTLALAALLSGSDAEAAQRLLAESSMRFPAMRLDVESALAFVESISRSAETAPAHLVEELLAADTIRSPRQEAAAAGPWTRSAQSIRTSRRWSMAAACLALLVAPVIVWSVHWPGPASVANSPAPQARTTSAPSIVDGAPSTPKFASEAVQPCAPVDKSSELAGLGNRPTVRLAEADTKAGCERPGHQFADDAAGKEAAQGAGDLAQQTEAARAAKDGRMLPPWLKDAEEAAAGISAAQSGRDAVRALRVEELFRTNGNRAAGAAAVPAARPADPALSR
jgi:hypothetical protein